MSGTSSSNTNKRPPLNPSSTVGRPSTGVSSEQVPAFSGSSLVAARSSSADSLAPSLLTNAQSIPQQQNAAAARLNAVRGVLVDISTTIQRDLQRKGDARAQEFRERLEALSAVDHGITVEAHRRAEADRNLEAYATSQLNEAAARVETKVDAQLARLEEAIALVDAKVTDISASLHAQRTSQEALLLELRQQSAQLQGEVEEQLEQERSARLANEGALLAEAARSVARLGERAAIEAEMRERVNAALADDVRRCTAALADDKDSDDEKRRLLAEILALRTSLDQERAARQHSEGQFAAAMETLVAQVEKGVVRVLKNGKQRAR